MNRKRFVFVLLALVLLLSATTASARNTPRQVDLVSQARALVAQKYGLNADTIQPVGKVARVKYPLQGIVVYESKFRDDGGTTYSIAVNTAGQEVSTETLDMAERAVYQARYGKLDKSLALALRKAAPDALVEVDIWFVDAEGNQEADLVKPVVDGSSNQREYFPTRSAEKQAVPEESAVVIDEAAWEATEAAIGRTEMARMEAMTISKLVELRRQGYVGARNDLAPVITVTMPVRAIRAWAKRADVDIIYKSAELHQEMNIARQAIGAHTVNSLGIKGINSKIAVVEYGGMVSSTNPFLAGITRDNPFGCAVDSHVTGISGIIRSTKSSYLGIAPRTNLWVGCGQSNSQIYTSTTRGISWGADTFSLSWYTDYTRSITTMDKFYDKIMIKYIDLVIKSAGNRGYDDGIVTSPGIGFNTLAVGSFDDMNTAATGDDAMAGYSSYTDPYSTHGDREKPEVAAPGTNIMSTTTGYPWIGNIGSGTSYAGPMVAGITSLMYQRNPGLKAWPESTKAIIMATAWHNLEGLSRLSDVDGAGGVSALEADYVARNNTIYGGWGGTNYFCATATDWNIGTMYLYAGYPTRVVIVWDQNPWYVNYANQPSADLDLEIFDPTMALVTGSYSWDNTYEIVEFTPAVDGTYTIQVDKTRCDANPKYIGWAWSAP